MLPSVYDNTSPVSTKITRFSTVSSLPSSRLPTTKVSAQLLYRVLPTTSSSLLLYLLTSRMLPHFGTLRWTFHWGWLCTLSSCPVTAVSNSLPFDEHDTIVKNSVQQFLLPFSSFTQPLCEFFGYLPSSFDGT